MRMPVCCDARGAERAGGSVELDPSPQEKLLQIRTHEGDRGVEGLVESGQDGARPLGVANRCASSLDVPSLVELSRVIEV